MKEQKWLNIDDLPHAAEEDEMFWFARSDGYVEGPREVQSGGYDYEEFDFFCPAIAPSVESILSPMWSSR